MACGSKNSWTKVISWLTIIFCLIFVILQILVVALYRSVGGIQIRYFDSIVFYLKKDPDVDSMRIEILLYCSIVLNLLWIITSVVLLIFLAKTEYEDYSMKETQKLIKTYILWIVFAFLCFIPEIVSAIINGLKLIDYYNSNSNNIITGNKRDTLKDGSLYLLLLSLRFVVIDVFHIISWIGMIIITSRLQNSITGDDTKPKGRIVPLKPPKPALKPTKISQLEETNVDRVRDWYKHYEGDTKNVGFHNPNYYSEPDVVPQYFPRVNGNTNPAFMSNVLTPISSSVPPPSVQQHHMPGSNTNVLVNGVTSGTLRRQLPWSYMPSGGGVPQLPPKRQFSPVPSNATTLASYGPYVPAPDYYEKPNRTSRQEFNEPGWKQYL